MGVRIFLFLAIMSVTVPVAAQSSATLACGQNISGQFATVAEVHRYPVFVNAGTRVIAHADALPLDTETPPLIVEVIDANAFVLESISPIPDETATVETEPLLRSGVYDIAVEGAAGTAYQLLVSCVDAAGDVRTDNNRVQPLACGQHLENTIVQPQAVHRYYIPLDAGETLTLDTAHAGTEPDITLSPQLFSPTNTPIEIENGRVDASLSGIYTLYVQATEGSYTLAAHCVLADGTSVIAADTPSIRLEPTELDSASVDLSAPPVFSAQANNTPPIAASTAQDIEVPLLLGTPNTGVITLDFTGVYAYQFEAAAGETFSLDLERIMGNMNLGVVISSDLQPILFDASLITSSTLYTEFTAPTDSTYTVRIAELDIMPSVTREATVFSVMVAPTR